MLVASRRVALRSSRAAAAVRFESSSGHAQTEKVKVHSSRLQSDGPSLGDFLRESQTHDHQGRAEAAREPSEMNFPVAPTNVRSLEELEEQQTMLHRSFFIETYGCQMNSADSEIVRAILLEGGYTPARTADAADVVLLNTCAVRDNAEAKIWNRLESLRQVKAKLLRLQHKEVQTVGVLGCMAERLKKKLLESDKMVDLVVGPDAYRDIPNLLRVVLGSGEAAVNVQLSLDETYADIAPVRADPHSPSAFVSIMRGCNNMCSYCIVPFTRGRERSRVMNSIVDEVRALSDQGVKEVVLLGQNVNSYHDKKSEGAAEKGRGYVSSAGFSNMFRSRDAPGFRFADLLDDVSRVDPEMRLRFTSPHPKDFPNEVLDLVNERPNICKQIHMPAQSGSTTMLERMRRGYSREAYLALVANMRARIPGVAISSDFIAGFCGETEEEHADTISLMRQVCYDQSFMFATRMEDDVSQEDKLRRLREVINTFSEVVTRKNHVEDWTACTLYSFRAPQALRVPNQEMPASLLAFTKQAGDLASEFLPLPSVTSESVHAAPGDYVLVRVREAGRHTLHATPVARTTLQEVAELVPAELLGARPHSLDALEL
ncbi:Methylthiotransferase/radical SAM-type protein [Phytophthora cactorum]|nr:Methylthiotransferase/radical SAM-type protein [Phytophthora cactorum]